MTREEALGIVTPALRDPQRRVTLTTAFGAWNVLKAERKPHGIPTATIISMARLLLLEFGEQEGER